MGLLEAAVDSAVDAVDPEEDTSEVNTETETAESQESENDEQAESTEDTPDFVSYAKKSGFEGSRLQQAQRLVDEAKSGKEAARRLKELEAELEGSKGDKLADYIKSKYGDQYGNLDDLLAQKSAADVLDMIQEDQGGEAPTEEAKESKRVAKLEAELAQVQEQMWEKDYQSTLKDVCSSAKLNKAESSAFTDYAEKIFYTFPQNMGIDKALTKALEQFNDMLNIRGAKDDDTTEQQEKPKKASKGKVKPNKPVAKKSEPHNPPKVENRTVRGILDEGFDKMLDRMEGEGAA